MPDVRRVEASATRQLRTLLRPGQPAHEIVLPGDDDPASGHFASHVNGSIVAVATILREPGAPREVFRIRGVATDAGHRGDGHGLAVVRACVEHARALGARTIWLQTTPDVVGWYEELGFRREGPMFPAERGRVYQRMMLDLASTPK